MVYSRGQIGENASSLFHFPHGSALGQGQVHQPRCGESFLCQSPKQKAVAVLWTWEWRWGRGAERIGEGRARNTKVLSTGSEWRKNVFKVFPPSPRQEVSAEMPEKGFCPSPPIKLPLNGGMWTGNAEMCESTDSQRTGDLDCNSLQRLQYMGCAPRLVLGGQLSFPVSLCYLLWSGLKRYHT